MKFKANIHILEEKDDQFIFQEDKWEEIEAESIFQAAAIVCNSCASLNNFIPEIIAIIEYPYTEDILIKIFEFKIDQSDQNEISH
jgi:hypothetical protein